MTDTRVPECKWADLKRVIPGQVREDSQTHRSRYDIGRSNPKVVPTETDRIRGPKRQFKDRLDD